MQFRTTFTVIAAILLPLGIASAGDSAQRKPAPTEIAPDDGNDHDVKPNDSEGNDGDINPNDSGDPPSSDTIISCWCQGGANGNGYASCAAAQCENDADACCSLAYGDGSEAED